MEEDMPDKYTGYKPFPNEPDEKEFWITGRGLVRTKQNRKTRIDNKWRKRYGYQEQDVTLHGLILRHSLFGHLNGYVGVPVGNVFYGKELEYNLIASSLFDNIHVHGGVTFSDYGSGVNGSPTLRKMKEGFWYVGFDTAHANDLVPEMAERVMKNPSLSSMLYGTYKDINYVERQVRRLAEQILDPSMIFKEDHYEESDFGFKDILQLFGGSFSANVN